MAVYRNVQRGRTIMGKLAHGADLLAELTDICSREGIGLGRVEALGAVQKARVGFYNQSRREYEFHDLDQPLEITKLAGNVSVKLGRPIVHAHVTLADSHGRAFGGHLAEGTIVFACEFIIEAFEGPELARGEDDQTGLPLWTID